MERLEGRLDELSRVATTPELFDEMRKRAGLEVKSTRQTDLLGREELEGGEGLLVNKVLFLTQKIIKHSRPKSK